MVTAEQLKSNPPRLHRNAKGELISTWRIDNRTIDVLDRALKPNMRTVETGAGLSTILFALHGCQHRCIVPDSELVSRIETFCTTHDVALQQVHFDIVPSQKVVHSLEEDTYDVALVDGLHNFPIAFIDFFYAAQALKTGGMLIIDDLHIWTCEMVAKFLREAPGWNVEEFTQRVCVARKSGFQGLLAEWREQPFVLSRSLAHSKYSPKFHAVRMAFKALREWLPA